MTALGRLIDIICVSPHTENQFWGQSQDLGWGSIYGGQLLGQSLYAAQQTVAQERHAHSLQAYFLARGQARHPVRYEVQKLRDGKSFSSRRVEAFQEGSLLYTASIRFKTQEEGFVHQEEIAVPEGPQGLYSEEEWGEKIRKDLPLSMRKSAVSERPIEVRLLQPVHPKHPKISSPKRDYWCRAHHELINTPQMQQCVFAWLSDGHLLTTSLLPHGKTWLTKGMRVGSLDHVIWFHRPLDMNRWWFYTMDSPIAAHARGFARGRAVQDGKLCATVMQEGLIRYRGEMG